MFPTFYIPQGGARDDYFGQVVLLLRGEGANGSTTFVDHSSYGRSVTRNGNVQMDTAKMRNGRPSIKFDATDDWLLVADAAELSIGALNQEWTFECWLWFDSSPTGGGIADAMQNFQNYPASSWEIYFNGSGTNFSAWSASANSYSVIAAELIPTGQWVHFAVCQSGSWLRMFYNGVQKGATNLGGSYQYNNGTEPLYIGGFGLYSRSSTMNGWMSECRFTVGYGRYSGAFTPDTADFPDQ